MKIIVSMGDPNGIGFECFLKSLDLINSESNKFDFTIVSNSLTIREYAESLNIDVMIDNQYFFYNNHQVKIIEQEYCPIEFGNITKDAGKFAVNSLVSASNLIKSGQYDALLTLPIAKHSAHLAGFNFPGHTEFLADIDRTYNPLMILFNDNMKMALATIHIPIIAVPNLITAELVADKLQLYFNSLKFDFGINNPKVAVLSLNPHAGEDGDIGNEEVSIITPALQELHDLGFNAIGPLVPDAFFRYYNYLSYDAVFAMYHDQGLIPLKMLSQNGGVNFTANLSFIRVSPDHGTGFDIAGKNIADPLSTLKAIHSSYEIHQNRINFI